MKYFKVILRYVLRVPDQNYHECEEGNEVSDFVLFYLFIFIFTFVLAKSMEYPVLFTNSEIGSLLFLTEIKILQPKF